MDHTTVKKKIEIATPVKYVNLVLREEASCFTASLWHRKNDYKSTSMSFSILKKEDWPYLRIGSDASLWIGSTSYEILHQDIQRVADFFGIPVPEAGKAAL